MSELPFLSRAASRERKREGVAGNYGKGNGPPCQRSPRAHLAFSSSVLAYVHSFTCSPSPLENKEPLRGRKLQRACHLIQWILKHLTPCFDLICRETTARKHSFQNTERTATICKMLSVTERILSHFYSPLLSFHCTCCLIFLVK